MRNTNREEVSFYYALMEERNKAGDFEFQDEKPQGLGLREYFKNFSLKNLAEILVGIAIFFAFGWIASL